MKKLLYLLCTFPILLQSGCATSFGENGLSEYAYASQHTKPKKGEPPRRIRGIALAFDVFPGIFLFEIPVAIDFLTGDIYKPSATAFKQVHNQDSVNIASGDNVKFRRWKKHHSDWTDEDCRRIENKELWIGMSYDMVVKERGLPNDIHSSNYGDGWQYQACWDDKDPMCIYFGSDNAVTGFN